MKGCDAQTVLKFHRNFLPPNRPHSNYKIYNPAAALHYKNRMHLSFYNRNVTCKVVREM